MTRFRRTEKESLRKEQTNVFTSQKRRKKRRREWEGGGGVAELVLPVRNFLYRKLTDLQSKAYLLFLTENYLEFLAVISGNVLDAHDPVLDQTVVMVLHRRSHPSAVVVTAHDDVFHLATGRAGGWTPKKHNNRSLTSAVRTK